jgi:CHAT domain-containing protein
VAESDYRQSIAIIEKSRSQLQLTALKTDFFADKREVYDSLIALLLKDQNIPEAFEMLERSRARSFRDRLELRNPQFDAAALTLTQAQAALDPATVLLEYWAAPHQIGLIWCTKQKYGMVLRETGPADEAAIHSLLGNLPESLVHASQEQATLLNNLFPAESALPPDIRHILIVPDGWISFLPLDLLHLRGATQPLLIEQYDISYLPTAALLRRVHEPERRLRFPWTRELVAFGDPSTKSSNSAPSFGDSDLTDSQPLPYSETEIRAIGELLPGASQLFLKQNDLKKFFLDGRANQAFLLHVSTHAFADIDNPENSRLLFSPSSDGGSADYVFLRQLYDLDLSNVHLATISACDSERGKLNRGEGVQAFSRALLSAGARSALTALWRVDDQPTAEFMRQFYFFALRRHTSKAEALRLAKLKFLHSNTRLSDPLIWATFILSGDGQTPLPAVISWTTLALATALFAGVSFVFASILLRHRRRIHGKHKA